MLHIHELAARCIFQAPSIFAFARSASRNAAFTGGLRCEAQANEVEGQELVERELPAMKSFLYRVEAT